MSTARCERCSSEISDLDEFCPVCGALLEGTFSCTLHPDRLASGACVICGSAYCGGCGHWTGGVFLCNEHRQFEVRQRHVQLFASRSRGQILDAIGALKGADLHAQLWSPAGQKMPVEALEEGLPPGDDLLVMVPLSEALIALDVLREHGLLETGGDPGGDLTER
jgi:hypothetical protein